MHTTPQEGRKIARAMENPVDDVLLQICDRVCLALCRRGITPNMVTAASGVAGLGAVWALNRGFLPAFAALWAVGYFLDCVDGHLARSCNMVTKLGDWFDHAKDYTVLALLLFVLYTRYTVPWWATLMIAGGALGSAVHLGCQQRVYAKDRAAAGGRPETLDTLQKLCPSHDAIAITRFFGLGTVNLFLIAVVWVVAS